MRGLEQGVRLRGGTSWGRRGRGGDLSGMPTACTSTGEGHLGKGMGQSLLACTQESHVPHCTEVKCVSPSVVSEPLQPWGLQPARLLCPWDSPGKNTGVGCQSLLQGLFLT